MRRSPFFVRAAAFSLAACADVPPDDLDGEGQGEPSAAAEHDDEDDLEALSSEDGEFVEKAACRSRWSLPSSVSQEGNGMSVPYEGAGRRCQGGPTAGAEALGQYLRSNFPDLVNQSVSGRGIQIYACRNIRGGSGLSVHSTGRAIDVFIPTGRGGAASRALSGAAMSGLIRARVSVMCREGSTSVSGALTSGLIGDSTRRGRLASASMRPVFVRTAATLKGASAWMM